MSWSRQLIHFLSEIYSSLVQKMHITYELVNNIMAELVSAKQQQFS